MKKIIFVFAGAVALFLFSCGNDKTQASGQDTSSGSATTVESADGSSLYSSKCVSCHGDKGDKGFMNAADLSKSTLDHPGIVAVLKNGRNTMRSFSGELDDAQIEAVAKYVESLRH
ncbi:MAG TPA: cytochrome c [Bacteroidia bacterium]|nr:cytochrome c [Bacteroidia bacterium]